MCHPSAKRTDFIHAQGQIGGARRDYPAATPTSRAASFTRLLGSTAIMSASEQRAHGDAHAPSPPFEEEGECGAVALAANGELLYWLHHTHDLPSAGGHLL